MNVKPTDIAKVVNSDNGNNGRTCYVMSHGYWEGSEYFWIVQLLEPAIGDAPATRFTRLVRFEAGEVVFAKDSKLRRVDPPEDDQAVDVVIENEVTA